MTRATLSDISPTQLDPALEREWIRGEESKQLQFDDYLSYHNEAAVYTRSAGILPYATIRVTDRQGADQAR